MKNLQEQSKKCSATAELTGYFAEIAIALAIFENMAFGAERLLFLYIAATCLVVALSLSLIKRASFKISLISTISLSFLFAMQIALSLSRWWHETLFSPSANLLGLVDMAAAAVLVLFAIIDILICSSGRGLKISIYLMAFLLATALTTSVKAGSNFLSFNSGPSSLDFTQLCLFILPLLYALLSLSTCRPHRTQRKGSYFSCILPLILLLVICWALFQAWQKVDQLEIASRPELSLELMPPQLIVPLLVAEDPVFFRHHGIDSSRLIEAVEESINSGKFQRGGSTISMQLFKVISEDYDKTLWRKFVQIIGGIILERKFTKLEILEKYLEVVPFGQGAVGIRQASHQFFGLSPDLFSKEQTLKLVATVYDPEQYNPSLKILPHDVQLRLAVIKARQKEIGNSILNDLKQNMLKKTKF